ncbi:Cna B-type domain-containing protein [Methanobrevibacter ruminantium]|uniref:Cna B-type domain-containing protein n=1 Tax=Methanobrevibacter ruminantium TaxID=83816 RepID=UPI001494D90E|nr:Cna B-type domain-containing protein [Methanobrevibacter ruminantium]
MILFCFISLLGTASAEDIYTDDIASIDASNDFESIEISNEEVSTNAVENLDVSADDSDYVVNGSSSKNVLTANELSATYDLSGSSVQNISDLFNSGTIQSGDVIYLGNQSISSSWDEWTGNHLINVNVSNIIISGGSSSNPDGTSTINANGAKLFNIQASGVTLTNIKVINAHGGNGPGCINFDGSDCSIINCEFENCQYAQGGAIHGTSSASNLIITNCNFTNNVGRWGGSGGAIYLEGSGCKVTDSRFEGNTAQNYGAIYCAGDINLNNCNFTSNGPGAIYGGGNTEVIDCNFISNTGSSVTVISGGSTKVRNSNFTDNAGASIYSGGNTEIKDVIFTNNGAGSYNNKNVGSVYSGGATTDVSNSKFDNNAGIAIYANENAFVDGCNITNGGVAIYSGSDANISNSIIENNSADQAIVYIYGIGKVNNSNFTNNTVSGHTHGGALSLIGDNSEVSDSIFADNTAGASGGAIYTTGENTMIKNCSFTDNTVMQDYGHAGAVDVVGVNTKIIDCNFTNNSAPNGGAVYGGSYGLSLSNSVFEDNNASTGGALYIYHDDFAITNCNFTDNDASSQGGAIYIASECHNEQMTGCNFSGNTAPRGSAIYCDGDGKVTDCNFDVKPDLTVSGGNSSLTVTLGSDYSNVVVGDIEGVSGGSVTPLVDAQVTVEIFDSRGNLVDSVTNATDENGKIKYDYSGLSYGSYTYRASHMDGDTLITKEGTLTRQASLDVRTGYPALTSTLGLQTSIDGTAVENDPFVNEDITVEIFDSRGNLVDSVTNATDENGQVYYDYSNLQRGTYTYRVTSSDGQTEEGPLSMGEVVGDNFSAIQAAIDNAPSGGVIFLQGKTYLNDIQGQMVIDKPITIIGTDGTVLDAQGISRVFEITSDADNVNLANMTLTNGNDVYGGAIYLQSGCDDGTLTDVVFDSNTAELAGGAIYNAGGNRWTIDNTTFTENEAHGETNYIYRGGGAIWSCDAEMILSNTTFVNNQAPYGGALRGAFDIYDSLFDNNTATDGNGGAIDVTTEEFLYDTLILEFRNSTFVNNDAKGSRGDDRAQGGAIHIYHLQEVNMYDCFCENNTADRGGAVDFYELGKTWVDNCTFVNNNASSEGGGLAIFCNSSTFKDSNVSNNIAGTDGGAIWVIGHNSLFNNVTSENNTASRGGSSYIEGENTTIYNSTFNNNNALYNESLGSQSGIGGALDILGDNCKVIGVTSVNNTAELGGSTFIRGDNTLVQNTNLSNNTAVFNESRNETSGIGGALDVVGNNCQIINVTSDNNNAYRGGSTFIRGNDTVIRNSTFDNNNATLRGGGLNIAGEGCTIFNVDVSNNAAGENGGGIYVIADGTEFRNITADNNTAERGGGAFVEGNDIIIDNGTFNGNKAIFNESKPDESGIGGALDIKGHGCNVTNVDSFNNTAYRGGSTFIRGDNTYLENCTLDGNNATLRGGGLNIAGENCTIHNVDISNNTAGLMGGGIYVIADGTVFRNITADNNSAERGGAVFVEGNDIIIDNATFNDNKAIFNESRPDDSGLGGALDIKGDGCNVTNVNSFNNTAYRGGSTFIRGDNTHVENCTLEGNNATLRGGGLNIAGENCTVYNVDVSNNTAGLMGGAIYVVANGTEFRNITANNNSAERGGGAFIEGNNVTIDNATFNNNRAIFNETRPDESGLGGALDIKGDGCNVTNVNSTNNTAYRGGSTFIRGDDTYVANCTLDGNNATLRGGGLNIAGDRCIIDDVDVSNNNAGLMGGGIYVVSNGTEFRNITADNNTAERGGSAFINGTGITIRDGELNNNRAIYNESRPDESGLGGGFDIVGDNILVDSVHSNNNSAYRGGSTFIRGSNVTVQNCNLDNNTATVRGGGLNIGGGDGCKVINVSVSNNDAGEDGGAVYVIGDFSLFDNVNSTNNTAQRGGSSFIAGNNVTVINCNLDNNTASNRGGGLDVNGSGCVFENVTLSNCHADKEGGAVYVRGDNVTFNNVTSENNTAERGGSSFVAGDNCKVINCDLNNNNATWRGGGLDVTGTNCLFENVTLSNCHSDEDGGAVYISGDDNRFVNVTSVNNTAVNYGGSTYIGGTSNSVENCTISNNIAYNGGGIFIEGEDSKFTNNNITFNKAIATDEDHDFNIMGGGVFILGGNSNFTNNNISSNHAKDNGGGVQIFFGPDTFMDKIYAFNNTAENGGFANLLYCDNLNVTNSTFYSNHATGDISLDRGEGGAFHMSYATNIDVQGNFSYNTATNGSAIYSDGSDIRVHDSSFFDNQAHSWFLLITPSDETYLKGQDVIINISHIGGDNIANAIHNRDAESSITVRNVTYPFYNNGVLINKTTPIDEDIPIEIIGYENSDNGNLIYIDDLEDNQVIYYNITNRDTNESILVGFNKTDISGTVSLRLTNLPAGNYVVSAYYPETTYYTEIRNVSSFRVIDVDMVANKTVDNQTSNVGDIRDWNVTIWNDGASEAQNVTIIDFLPDGLNLTDNLTIHFYNGTGGLWNNAVLNLTSNNLTFSVYNKADGTWINGVASYDESSNTWTYYVLSLADNRTFAYSVFNQSDYTDAFGEARYYEDINSWTYRNISYDVDNADWYYYTFEYDDHTYVYGVFNGSYFVDAFGEARYYEDINSWTYRNISYDATTGNWYYYTFDYGGNTFVYGVFDESFFVDAFGTAIYDDGSWNYENISYNATDGKWYYYSLNYGDDSNNVTYYIFNPENFVDVFGSNYHYNAENNTYVYVNAYYDAETDSLIRNDTIYNVSSGIWTINNRLVVPELVSINPNVSYISPEKIYLVNKISLSIANHTNSTDISLDVGRFDGNGSVLMNLVTNVTKRGNFTNIVNVTTDSPEKNYTNNVANNSTIVYNDLVINKTVSDNLTNVSGIVDWNVTVLNNGTFEAVNVTMNDYLPDGLDLTNLTVKVYNGTGSLWTNATLDLSTMTLSFSVYNETSGEWISGIAAYDQAAKTWTYYVLALDDDVLTYTAFDETFFSNLFGDAFYNESSNVWTFVNRTYDEVTGDLISEVNTTYDNNTGIWTIGDKTFVEYKVNLTLVNGTNSTNLTLGINSLDENSTMVMNLVTNVTKYGIFTNVANVTTVTPETNYTNNVANNTTETLTNITVTKVWDDANNQDGIRPTSVNITLIGSDGSERSVLVTGTGGVWNYTFTDLPMFNSSGDSIVYTVNESVVPNGYDVSYNQSNWTVYNTHVPEVTNITVTKVWEDANNQDGIRPTSVNITLIGSDGSERSVLVTGTGGVWNYTFTDLPMFNSSGDSIVYTVNESVVPNGYDVSYNQSNWTVYNTHVPEVTNITVTKVWEDANNQDGIRPSSVNITLIGSDGTERSVLVTENNGVWNYTFTDLPVYNGTTDPIVYTVNESVVPDGYEVSYNQSNWTVYNTHIPELVNITVTKVWEDANNQDGIRPTSVNITLIGSDGTERSVLVTENNGVWNYTFTDLPVYNGTTDPIVYTVNESVVPDGYEVSYNQSNWTVYNTHIPELVNITVTKVWEDANNQDGIRPTSVNITLIGSDGSERSVLVTETDGVWNYTFTDLPVYNGTTDPIVYTVIESVVPDGYEVSYNQSNWTVYNAHVPEVTNITVTKVWEDANNQDGIRPSSVNITLIGSDGTERSVLVTETDGVWNYTFTDLPVYNGTTDPIVYTVIESVVPVGYEVSYNQSNWTVYNTHVPEIVNITVTKIWEDANNQDGIRPGSVNITLIGSDGTERSVLVTENNGVWNYTFTDLPVYNGTTDPIVYTVNESVVPVGYEVSYNQSNRTVYNTHVPEIVNITVTKIWEDANNQDGIRPGSVNITLIGTDGTERSVLVTENNGVWNYTFTDLPVYNGTTDPIVYTVNESVVPVGYEVSYNQTNWTVYNTHVPEIVNITVTKIWEDANNQDGIRPISVNITLIGSDGTERSVLVTGTDGWNYTFKDLPKFNGTTVPIVYTVNESVVPVGYEVSYNQTNWTVYNTHVPELVNITVTKVWEDANNQDGIRPISVNITLIGSDGTERSVLVTGTDGWNYTFKDLPKFNGTTVPIVYIVNESVVPVGYDVSYNQSNWTVYNTHVPNVTEINVTKVWNDSNDKYGIRPSNVTIELFADGKKVNETNLTARGAWTYTFSGLPQYNNGKLINYTIGEVRVDGYSVLITNNTVGNWTVTNTPIAVPNMTVQKIANDKVVYIGNVTSFTILVRNTGDCNLSGVYVVDSDYSAGLSYLRYENGSRDWTYDGAKWTLVGNLTTDNPTANFTVYFTVVDNGTLVNNVSAGSNLTNETNGTNNTTAYRPNMTIQKVSNDEVVYVGNITSFTIVVTNTGDCNLSDIVVTDSDFSAGLSYLTYANGTRNWNYDAVGHTWSLVGDLTNGSSAEFTVFFTVIDNGTLVNNASVRSNLTNETNATNNTTAYRPNMTIQKISNDEVVYVGNITSFTIVVTNTGDCNLSDIVVTDSDFSAGLSYLTYANGTRNWNYDAVGHTWSLVGDLTNGSSAEFTVFFTVIDNGTLVNNASVRSNLTNETNATNNTTAYRPNMTIQKISNDEVVYVGNITSFTIVVTNTGDCNLSDIVVTDSDFSAGLSYLTYANGTRNWNYDAVGHTWSLVGDLTNGSSAEFTVFFTVIDNGTLVNNASVRSNLTNETNATNNTTAYRPNMTIQKISNDEVVYVGNITSFTIVVTNTGDCNLSDIVVTDSDFSAGLSYLTYANGTRNWNYDAVGHTWSLVGDLTNGSSAEFTVFFTVIDNGTLVNNASVRSNLTNETNATNNTTAYRPNMTIQKISNDEVVYVGNITSFTIVVTNTGDCNLSEIVVTDNDYSLGLKYSRYENSSRLWNYNGGKFTLVGDLAPGNSANLTVFFIVVDNGTLVNNASVKSNLTNETNATNNTTAYRPNMTVQKVSNDQLVYVGNETSFTIIVTNTGDCNLTGVYIKDDDFSKGLQYNNKFVPVKGTWTYAGGRWNLEGQLTVGDNASITVYFTVIDNGTLVNNATAGSNLTNETNATNNTTAYRPNMTVQKISNDGVVYLGNTTSFTIVVTNTGDCSLSEIVVTDNDYSAGLQYSRYANTSSKWNYDGDKFTLVGDLAPGASANLTVFFIVIDNGTLVNNASVKSNLTNETNATNNTTAYRPNMTVEKLIYEDTVYVGDTAIFTIFVKNTGDCSLSDVVICEYWFSEGLEYNGVWVPNGDRKWDYDDETRTWTLIGDLAPEGFASFVVYFNVTKNGTLYNNISAKSNLTNETNATNSTRAYLPNMTVMKVANDEIVYLGNTTSFTIVVSNTGDCNLSEVVVTDTDYSTGLKYKNYINGSANWNYNNGEWSLVGDLTPGSSANFTVFFTVVENGTLVNNASASSNLTNKTNTTNNTTAYSPKMTVLKISNDESVYVGNITSFTILVSNVGDCDLSGIYVIDDDYSNGLLYNRYENSSRKWNYDGSRWTLVGSLEPGDSANFTVFFDVVENGTLVNNVSAGSNLTNETNNTNNTTAKPVCDLIIYKAVNATEILVYDIVEWKITVVNLGPDTALDVIVKDLLDNGLELISVSGGNYNNITGEWNIGDLEPNTPVSLSLVTRVLVNGTIVNTATVNTTSHESNYTNNNASNFTEADYLCDLVISKAVNCTNCNVSDLVQWNITVTNLGPHDASNVIVKEILPKGLELIDYNVSVGNFNEVISEWSIGTLEKDTAVSLVLVTKVLIDGTLINIATVNTTTLDNNYTNNVANNTTVASPICDLVISKIVNATKVNIDDILTWTVRVTNNGPSEALNVCVSDILPEGLMFVGYKASTGRYDDESGTWTVGKLSSGSSATINIYTKVIELGNITNPVSVNTTTVESNYSNNKANNTTEVYPIVDLVIEKSSDKIKYNVNDTMHWIIKVMNEGPCDAIEVYVYDALPASTKFIAYNSSKGTFDAAKGIWSIGDLANGEEVTLDICCKALISGNFTNNATVNCSITDKNTSNNFDNATIEIADNKSDNPDPIPDKPKHGVDISLRTGNPLLIFLMAIFAIFGGIGLRCRKE